MTKKKISADETFLRPLPSVMTKGEYPGKEEVRAVNENEVRERFAKIYDANYDYIYKYLLVKTDSRETAEDILQNVFLSFYKRMLAGDKVLDPKHYLLRAAKHKLTDHYRSRRVTESLDNSVEIVDEKALGELENDSGYAYEEIMQSLKEADEVTYKIFVLHFGHDYTIEKTAKTLGMAESTVKSKLYRSLKKLKNRAKEGEGYALFGRN